MLICRLPACLPRSMASPPCLLLLTLLLTLTPPLAFCFPPKQSLLHHHANALLSFKARIAHDPFHALHSWQSSTNPCSWSGVGCHQSITETRITSLEITSQLLEGELTALPFANLTHLSRLVLQGNSLTGPVPAAIGFCRRLQVLDLRDNRLSGSLPHQITGLQHLEALHFSGNELSGTLDTIFSSATPFPNLQMLDLSRNHLIGKLPANLVLCSSLQEIRLDRNQLVGTIPDNIGGLKNLLSLFLNDNLLTGPLPPSLVTCFRLQFLDVANNVLSGSIPPALAEVAGLRYFNVSNNQLHGPIPAGPWLRYGADVDAFVGNSELCGWPLDPCNSAKSPSSALPASVQGFSRFLSERFNIFHFAKVSQNVPGTKGTRRSSVARNLAAKNPARSPAPGPAGPILSKRNKRNKAKQWGLGLGLGMVAGAASAVVIFLSSNAVIAWINMRRKELPIIFRRDVSRKLLAFLEKDGGLEGAQLIGEGGAGQVYKATLENGKVIAIKKVTPHISDIMEGPEQSFVTKNTRQIRAELETLGKIRHRNLVSLLAYIPRPHAHLLIYEYLPNGSLHEVLSKSAEGSVQLTWPSRYKIAVGVAQGLTYLHFHCVPRLVHRDLKPGNILLDEDFEPHLGDFGLAKALPENVTHFTSNNVAGTVGYIAPEYHQTLRYTEKCDVYSFGVVLTVLVTGKSPTDDMFVDVTNMGAWIRNCFQSGNAIDAFDPKLRGEGFEEEMALALKIAVFCTADAASERPSSQDVLNMLLQIRR